MGDIEHLTAATFQSAVDRPVAAQAGVVGADQLVEALDRLAAEANRDRNHGEGGVMSGTTHWPLERVLFALAGTVTLISAALAAAVSPWFLLVTAFVGVNQWLYVAAGACPASIVLRHACKLRSAIYPDRADQATSRQEVTV